MTKRGLARIPKRDRKRVKKRLADIALEIQSRREALGFTQESFAEHLDVSIGTVKTIEQGSRIPSLPILLWFADALDLKIVFKNR